MSKITINSMRNYLSSSISSINRNKINGTIAEIDLRNTLTALGFGDKISQGGWIVRNVGNDIFGHHSVVLFPQTIMPNVPYSEGRKLEDPAIALHTICSTMHQIGVQSFYCVPSVAEEESVHSINWDIRQLGIPTILPYSPLFPTLDSKFTRRTRKYNFLKYKTNTDLIPEASIAEEFTKEHLRVTFQNHFMCEMSDIDGVLWGQQYTYPIEIKEKTVAHDNKLGYYFGIDIGPFVKLAFYAAKKGNLRSLFIVREINNTEDRELVNWWYITFDTLAQYASWIPQEGGRGMMGGRASVVRIPRAEFKVLTAANLALL